MDATSWIDKDQGKQLNLKYSLWEHSFIKCQHILSCSVIKHSDFMVIKMCTGTFGSVDRYKVLLDNNINIPLKLVSRGNFLVDGCSDFGFGKNTVEMTCSRWYGTLNHHWLWKLHTGPLLTWFLCLCTRPAEIWTLITKWQHDLLSPLNSNPVLFLFSTGKRCLTLTLVHEWLFARKMAIVIHVLMSVCNSSWNSYSSCNSYIINLPHTNT